MDYKSRIGMGSGPSYVGAMNSQPSIGGSLATSFSTSGQATGPALVLVLLVGLLVVDYVWTRGQQGGR